MEQKAHENQLIPGGYILLSRKIIDSAIMKKPPLYLKVWVYLLSRAQWQTYKGLSRGQLYTSYQEIREATSWYEGARKEMPSRDKIYNVLEWLRCEHESDAESVSKATTKATMIKTTKATRGILINIENYCIYQDSKNYESNTENISKATPKAGRKRAEADTINEESNKNNNYSYQNLFDYYNTLGLTKHRKLTPEMKKAIDRAQHMGCYSWDDLKTLLDRHAYIVKLTADKGDFKVQKRTLTEFFGQKVNDGSMLICSEYADDGPKWLKYKDGNPRELEKDWSTVIEIARQYGPNRKEEACNALGDRLFGIVKNNWYKLCTANDINQYKEEFTRVWKQG